MRNGDDLGAYVRAYPRENGTYRVYFEVPSAKRPVHWAASIPLPLDKPRSGDLNDGRERARIRRDAAALLERLKEARSLAPPSARQWERGDPVSFRHVETLWHASPDWTKISLSRQKRYRWQMDTISKWDWGASETRPNLPKSQNISEIDQADCERFLNQWANKPGMKKDFYTPLNIIFKRALGMRLINFNPMSGVRQEKTTPKVDPWKLHHVISYSEACVANGHPALAVLIYLAWRTGQRHGDILKWEYGRNLINGRIRYVTGKTRRKIEFRLPKNLLSILEYTRRPNCRYLLPEPNNDRPYPTAYAAKCLRDIRLVTLKTDAPELVLRSLRHSCISRLADNGESILNIASLTGHSLNTVVTVLNRYNVHTEERATAVLKRDHVHHGGTETDFDFDGEEEEDLWPEMDAPARPFRGRATEESKRALIGAIADSIDLGHAPVAQVQRLPMAEGHQTSVTPKPSGPAAAKRAVKQVARVPANIMAPSSARAATPLPRANDENAGYDLNRYTEFGTRLRRRRVTSP